MISFDVVVIGGGSAGMASALKAKENGVSVAIIERDDRLGGILNQCIHNGFGLNYFKKELTGPEYANLFIEKVKKSNIKVFLLSTVLKIENNFEITVINGSGLFKISAKSIVLATGCRERPAGAISLCGSRPAGVISAGSAQKFVNIYGKMIGKNIVIVGSGDIGLIMARRLRFEGANVIGVYEIMPYPSGLKRNIVQCLEDYNIPLHLSKTVVEVVGEDRVKGVYVAPVNSDYSFDLTKKELISCDAVVLSIGLVPENEVAIKFGVKQNAITGGAVVDEYLQTSIDGIFACGNGLHVHDIVDNVSKEAERAGENSAKFVKNLLSRGKSNFIKNGFGVRYVNPSNYYESDGILTINFRVSNIFKNAKIIVMGNGKIIREINKNILLPAEMESVILSKKGLRSDLEVLIKTN
ncbi:MAG: FAD-dependent oxidoreductase [Clostridia bacterium]|nr:FAD-dependent oxidoreductase [Clostridia bacterium]